MIALFLTATALGKNPPYESHPVDIVALIPDDLASIDWQEVNENANVQCKTFRTSGEYAGVVKERIQATNSLIGSLEVSLNRLDDVRRVVNSDSFKVGISNQTKDLHQQIFGTGVEISTLMESLNADTVQLAEQATTPEHPQRRLHGQARILAKSDCVGHLLHMVFYLAQVDYLLTNREVEINCSLLEFYTVYFELGPPISLNFPNRPRAQQIP